MLSTFDTVAYRRTARQSARSATNTWQR